MRKPFICAIIVGFTLPFLVSGQIDLSKTVLVPKLKPMEPDYAKLAKTHTEDQVLEIKNSVAIYNETVLELDHRAAIFHSNLESGPAFFDVADRAVTAGLEATKNFPADRVNVLTDLSQRMEQVRKVMQTRKETMKHSPSILNADLHRARALCLRLNFELYRAQKATGPLVPPKLIPVP
jgi:hypothetical protein